MKKVYRKLTKEQKERGVIFSSCLEGSGEPIVHEVMESQSDKWETIERLKDDKFFNNSPFTHNLIRQ